MPMKWVNSDSKSPLRKMFENFRYDNSINGFLSFSSALMYRTSAADPPPPPNPHNLGPIVREGMTGTRDFAGKMITENWSMYSQIQRVLPPATPMGNYCPPTLRQKGKESSSCLRQAERTADMPRLSCALSCRTHLVDCLLSRAGAGEAGPTGTCI